MPDTIDEGAAENRAETLEELRSYIATRIAEGFDAQEDITEGAIDFVADSDAPERFSHEQVEELVAQQWKAQLAAQAAWTETTDCDRLNRAFAALETQGVVARQNWTCCQNCGHAEIGDELEGARAKGVPVKGYTFFHQQDTESAATGGGLLLAYGIAGKGSDRDVEQVGSTIVTALQAEGLKVSWEGSVKQRILVHVDWKKRLEATG